MFFLLNFSSHTSAFKIVSFVNAQQATQVLQASTSAISNLNQLTSQSRQQLSTIYRTSHAKLLEISTNRNLNEALRAQEVASIRRILKNQLANWRSTLNEKIAFMERDMQNGK